MVQLRLQFVDKKKRGTFDTTYYCHPGSNHEMSTVGTFDTTYYWHLMVTTGVTLNTIRYLWYHMAENDDTA